MATPRIPRPTTELFPESLNLSPKQREVLTTLQTFPEGARAVEVADRLGMHVNTARGHLDELVSKGAVRVFTGPANGRGRPSLIFMVRIPDNREIANEYVSLIELLISILSEKETLTDNDLEKARTIGRNWAREMDSAGEEFSTVDETLEALSRKLREMGFDPTLNDRTDAGGPRELALHACPFITADGERPSPFICGIHEGFVRETLGDTPNQTDTSIHVELKPFDSPGRCAIHFTEPTA